MIGGTLHFLNLCIRIRRVPDSDLSREDVYREHEGDAAEEPVAVPGVPMSKITQPRSDGTAYMDLYILHLRPSHFT